MGENIAKNIRLRMAELDENYVDIAKKMGVSSHSLRLTVANIKNGKDVRLFTLEKIASALNTSVSNLVT